MITQGKKCLYSQEWTTPPELIEWIENRFGQIDLDIAASKENAICERYFTKEHSAFKNPWKCKNGFFNPPFDMIEMFCLQADVAVNYEQDSKRVIGLFPLNVVGNKYWPKIGKQYSYRIELNPRVQYVPHAKSRKKGNAVNGPSQLVIWDRDPKVRYKIKMEVWK